MTNPYKLAADRIEELEAELSEARMQALESEGQAADALDKATTARNDAFEEAAVELSKWAEPQVELMYDLTDEIRAIRALKDSKEGGGA